jgi:UDP-glucose 4-epimerase
MRDAIVITGISGNLGRALAKLLHRRDRVVGIDRRPMKGKPKDIEVHQIDLRRKKTEDIFRRGDVKALIHMGIMHDPRMSQEEHHTFNVYGTTQVLDYAARYKVPKVVVLSSATVYGPSPNNDNFLTEDAPLMAGQRFSDIRDLVEVDMYAQQYMWKHPEVETVVLRPVHIVGATIKNAPSNYMRLERPLALAGFAPMVQLIETHDVCRAMEFALRPGLRGVYNVVGPGEVPLSAIFRELGRRPIPVPSGLARPLLRRLWDARLSTFPPPELDHIQFLCTVDGARFVRDAGWRPSLTLRETIRSVIGEAPLHRADFAMEPSEPTSLSGAPRSQPGGQPATP